MSQEQAKTAEQSVRTSDGPPDGPRVELVLRYRASAQAEPQEGVCIASPVEPVIEALAMNDPGQARAFAEGIVRAFLLGQGLLLKTVVSLCRVHGKKLIETINMEGLTAEDHLFADGSFSRFKVSFKTTEHKHTMTVPAKCPACRDLYGCSSEHGCHESPEIRERFASFYSQQIAKEEANDIFRLEAELMKTSNGSDDERK